jgi:hypothetical protein
MADSYKKVVEDLVKKAVHVPTHKGHQCIICEHWAVNWHDLNDAVDRGRALIRDHKKRSCRAKA